MKHFHNTINLSGKELLVADGKCKNQEIAILDFFERHPNMEYTPFEVQEAMSLYKTPITSIRRAMTNLTEKDHLIKTNNQAKGIYDKPNYKWKFNFKSTLF